MVVGHVQPPSHIVIFTQEETDLLSKQPLRLVQWSFSPDSLMKAILDSLEQ
jgi:hypothetical protein